MGDKVNSEKLFWNAQQTGGGGGSRFSPLGGVIGWPLRMDIKTKDDT